MRLAIVNENFGIGGLERVSSVIGQALSEKHEVYYYSMFGKDNFYDIKENFYVGNSKPLKNKWLNMDSYKKQIDYTVRGNYVPSKYSKEELQSLNLFIQQKGIELVLISSPKIISFIPKIQKVNRVKCIAWLHNNYDVYMKNYTKKYNGSFVEGLHRADAAVCLTKSDLKNYSLINKNTYCIYNPLTLENTTRADLLINNIAFTGRLSFEHKGIDYLVEIAKKIPANWTITIAGNGSEKEKKQLNQLIKDNHLETKLLFNGPLKGKNLINHYKNSSIYLMTSRWEGMPLVLAEAMSFGLPIIAFEQTGSSEVLMNGKYGCLVKNGDINEMSKKISQLITQENLRMSYSKQSLERVKDFNIEKLLEEWNQLIAKFSRTGL